MIKRAIIDKNARIGDGVVITPDGKPDNYDSENYYIRDGVVVVPKNAVLPQRELGLEGSVELERVQCRLIDPPTRRQVLVGLKTTDGRVSSVIVNRVDLAAEVAAPREFRLHGFHQRIRSGLRLQVGVRRRGSVATGLRVGTHRRDHAGCCLSRIDSCWTGHSVFQVTERCHRGRSQWLLHSRCRQPRRRAYRRRNMASNHR